MYIYYTQCRQHTVHSMLSVALTAYLIKYRQWKWLRAHLDMMYSTGRLQQEERGRASSNTHHLRATTYSTLTALLYIKHCCSLQDKIQVCVANWTCAVYNHKLLQRGRVYCKHVQVELKKTITKTRAKGRVG